MRVEFVFKNGRRVMTSDAQARLLTRLGRGQYATRDMVAAPVVALVIDLDAMSREDLHALAKERGVKVHHMAGAEKVREALRAQ